MIEFDRFLAAIGRPEPYSWQRRFAARCASGAPPEVIAVPTGAGKTTAVDALVWALACQAGLPAGQRTVGARIVWAIDRRILVDEVHAHAQDLAARLGGAASGPLREVADRLRELAGDDIPLVATRWRGGIVTEHDLYGPLQPQVITSTVAQFASRLLFRGFGVAAAGQALAAGLAACDTTICLDEAHLVEPFRQTVESVRAQRRIEASVAASLPGLGLITITATPHHNADESSVIALDKEDWANDELVRRLTARKSATLVEPEGTTDRERVGALVEATLAYVRDGAGSVACVVNSVRRAREVHRQLRVALPKLDDAPELGLLIGPQRPADRAEFLDAHGPKLFGRGDEGKRIVCVATQTFEVGLDADVEAMVTESASATALIQRLGRLNRRGVRDGAAEATILRDEGSWLYQADEGAAWAWLEARVQDGKVDVSVAALADGAKPPRPAHRPQAPELTEVIVDALSCRGSSLGVWQDVAVEAFWRPGEERRADVSLCWRADLRPELTGAAADAYRAMLLELVPPQPEELLTLTVNGARAVLTTLDAGASKAGAAARLALAEADVEGETPAARLPESVVRKDGLPFLVLRGDELLRGTLDGSGEEVVRPAEIRPGDVIVLPARLGPQHAAEVFPQTDVAGDVRPSAGAPLPVRITPEALRVGDPDKRLTERTWRRVARVCAPIEKQLADPRDAADRSALVGRLVPKLRQLLPEHGGLARLEAVTADPAWQIAFRRLELDRSGQPAFDPGDDDLDAVHDDRESATSADELEADAGDEDLDPVVRAGGTLTDPTAVGRDFEPVWVLVPIPIRDREALRDGAGAPPTIDEHGRAVRVQLERYLARLALPEAARTALVLAAAVHDHGKADPRMQAHFRRGVDDFGAEPIAKSTFGTRNPSVDRIARRLSGLPRRWRHESRSCAVLADARASGAIAIDGCALETVDWPLSFDSVGGHHGVGFPLPPVAGDGASARRFHVDGAGVSGSASGEDDDGWAKGASLSHALDVRARYGAWGVAYLEGLLMLADRVVSRRGE
jgi:CRISPR-associated endonuclease/helicase Cas3